MIQIIPNFLPVELFKQCRDESRQIEYYYNTPRSTEAIPSYGEDIINVCASRLNLRVNDYIVKYKKRHGVKFNPHMDYVSQLHVLIYIDCPTVSTEQGTFFSSGKQQEDIFCSVAPIPNLAVIWAGPRHPAGGTFHGSIQALYPNPQERTTINVLITDYISEAISGPMYKEGKEHRLLDWRATEKQLSDI